MTFTAFAARQRFRVARGNSDNQVIWFTHYVSGPRFDQTPEALEVMDEWMMNILANPSQGVAGNKPPRAVDRFFDAAGVEIAAGANVWDGILNDNFDGPCTQRFPIYGTSHIVAGGPFKGSIFKCQLKSVADAIADGDYDLWVPTLAQQGMLMQIFPQGVCNFDIPDAGLPPGW